MKKIIIAFCAVIALSSCGSSWNIQGNNLIIHKAECDTIVPAGSYYIIPNVE